MTWIRTIDAASADPQLTALYQRVRGPDNQIDQILLAHGLRPHTLEGHMALYKSVLHHSGNSIDRWFLEALGIYTSQLNGCQYCVEHHAAGMRRLIDSEPRSAAIMLALTSESFSSVFEAKQIVALEYVKLLTLTPDQINRELIERMRKAGWSDGEILEINQVAAYFNYANRTVLGLGVETKGEILGLTPQNQNNPANWQHQ